MDRTHEWLRERVREHGPSKTLGNALALARALETMITGAGMAFGMVFNLPDSTDLATVRGEAIAALAAWVEILDGDALTTIEKIVAKHGLPIDVAKRRATLAKATAAYQAELLAAERLAAERAIAWRASLAEQRAAEPTAPALEDDPSSIAVYADWLQQRGDARGELMALQQAAVTNPALAAEVDAFITNRSADLLGPLAPFEPRAQWHLGVLDHVTLGADDPVGALGILLNRSIGRPLRSLCIPTDRALIDLLIEFPPAQLRELYIGPIEFAVPRTIGTARVGDVSRLIEALPNLRVLVVEGADIEITQRLESDALERLILRTSGMPSATIDALARTITPALFELEVWFGRRREIDLSVWDEIAALVTRGTLPALRSLGLRNAEMSLAICQTIVQAQLLPQLETLDLSLGTMDHDGAHQLLEQRASLRHLLRLDVSHNYLRPSSITQLASAVRDVRAEGQLSIPDDRRVPYTARG